MSLYKYCVKLLINNYNIAFKCWFEIKYGPTYTKKDMKKYLILYRTNNNKKKPERPRIQVCF